MEDFAKDYASLKKDYMMALSSAIRGKNPDDVQKVLKINSEIGSRIQEFLKVLASKKDDVDYTTIEQLKTDLIAHQQEYDRISRSEDKLKTLKIIKASKDDRLAEISNMYYFYLFALVCLCFLIGYLVFATNVSAAVEGGGIFLKKRVFLV
jgi:hypothetical protein